MKKSYNTTIIVLILFAILFISESSAQSFKKVDEIPLDISYYRTNRVSQPVVKVIYGRPTLKKKKAFGDQVPLNKLWRTGANEATEVKFYQDIMFGDQKIPAGTYVLLTIPGEKEWQIILNTKLDVWGAFQYDPDADIARIRVPVSKAERLEVFSIAFKRIKNEIQMVLGWDSTRVKIPLKIEDIVVAKL
ncbi:MAG: DUF2911 domain-containing protein [Aureibaculum sp.]